MFNYTYILFFHFIKAKKNLSRLSWNIFSVIKPLRFLFHFKQYIFIVEFKRYFVGFIFKINDKKIYRNYTIPVLNGEHLSYVSLESVLLSNCSSSDNFPVNVCCWSRASGESFDLRLIPANGVIGCTLGRP